MCSLFGAVVNVDGSSAPLQHMRPFPKAKYKEVPRVGCAVGATGLFNVPLCPYITFPYEAPVTSVQVFTYLAAEASASDPDMFPLGLVDDNVDATFAITADLLHAVARHLINRELLHIDKTQKQ